MNPFERSIIVMSFRMTSSLNGCGSPLVWPPLRVMRPPRAPTARQLRVDNPPCEVRLLLLVAPTGPTAVRGLQDGAGTSTPSLCVASRRRDLGVMRALTPGRVAVGRVVDRAEEPTTQPSLA
jgi:hypothetical protein